MKLFNPMRSKGILSNHLLYLFMSGTVCLSSYLYFDLSLFLIYVTKSYYLHQKIDHKEHQRRFVPTSNDFYYISQNSQVYFNLNFFHLPAIFYYFYLLASNLLQNVACKYLRRFWFASMIGGPRKLEAKFSY